MVTNALPNHKIGNFSFTNKKIKQLNGEGFNMFSKYVKTN